MGGSDADLLFSGLFRRLFCFGGRDYLAALAGKRKEGVTTVVPAFLCHVTSLVEALSAGERSCLAAIAVRRRRKRRLRVEVSD